MNLKRTATIVVGGAAVGAWLAGAATSNRAIGPPLSIAPTPAIDMRGAELASEIARLHERLRPDRRRRDSLAATCSRSARARRTPAPIVAAAPQADARRRCR